MTSCLKRNVNEGGASEKFYWHASLSKFLLIILRRLICIQCFPSQSNFVLQIFLDWTQVSFWHQLSKSQQGFWSQCEWGKQWECATVLCPHVPVCTRWDRDWEGNRSGSGVHCSVSCNVPFSLGENYLPLQSPSYNMGVYRHHISDSSQRTDSLSCLVPDTSGCVWYEGMLRTRIGEECLSACRKGFFWE